MKSAPFKFAPLVLFILLNSCAFPVFLPSPSGGRDALKAFYEGDLDAAAAAYERTLSSLPDNSEALEDLAVIDTEKNDPEAACCLYERINLQRSTAPLLTAWGFSAYCANRLTTAAAVFTDALGREPGSRDALWGRGLTRVSLGDLQRARSDFELLTRAHPSWAQGHLELARVQDQLRFLDAAETEYKKALKLDPSLSEIHIYLASLYERERRFDESVKRYKKAQVIYPEDEEVKAKAREVALLSPGTAARESKELLAREKQRREEPAPLVAPPGVTLAPLIRVGIVPQTDRIMFTASVPFEVLPAGRGTPVFQGGKNTEYLISVRNGRGSFEGEGTGSARVLFTFGGAVTLRVSDPRGTFRVYDVAFAQGYFFGGTEDRAYRGDLVVEAKKNSLSVVNLVSLEEYLYGVIAAEMPVSFPLEALKAQVIAARSETLRKKNLHGSQGFDVCAEMHCQVYQGVSGEVKEAVRAVDETRGQVIQMGGKVVDAVYMSNCGGRTESGEEVWDGSLPGLVAVRDADPGTAFSGKEYPLSPARLQDFIKSDPESYCSFETLSYRWVKVLTRNELLRLRKKNKSGNIQWVKIGRRTPSGYVRGLTVFGKDGSKEWFKDRIRGLFGNLKSNLFMMMQKVGADGDLEWMAFWGAGYGHGVGLCQDGAGGMARKGYTAEKIVKHYYPGADIVKLY